MTDLVHPESLSSKEDQTRARGLVTPTIRGAILGLAFLLSHVSPIFATIVAIDILFFARRPRIIGNLKWILPTILFCALIEVAVSIFNPVGSKGVFVAVFGALCFAYGIFLARNIVTGHIYVLSGFIIATIIPNIAGYALGLRPAGTYISSSQNVIGTAFGITQRVHFPFADGINVYGTLMGLFLVISGSAYLIERRPVLAICFALSLVSLAMVDSRGALSFGALSLAAGIAAIKRQGLGWITIASLLALPLALLTGDWINEVFSGFARVGTDVTSGRLTYWSSIIGAISANPWNAIFGYGVYGTSSLGINLPSLAIFDNLARAEIYPGPHNMWLTLLVDGGIIKFAAYLAVFLSCARAPNADALGKYGVPFCGIFYALTIGTIETSTEYTRPDFLFVVAFLLGYTLYLREK